MLIISHVKLSQNVDSIIAIFVCM